MLGVLLPHELLLVLGCGFIVGGLSGIFGVGGSFRSLEQGCGFFAAGGVAAGKEFAIGVVREAFEDGGQGLHHLLQLGGVLRFAGEVFLFTGIASEVIELVGLEGGLVGLTGA